MDQNDDDDESLVEEAEEIVGEIVSMFGGDNTTVSEVVEEVEEIMGGGDKDASGDDAINNSESTEKPKIAATPKPTAKVTNAPQASPRVKTKTAEPTEAQETFEDEEGETEEDDVFNKEEFYKNRPVSGSTSTTTPTSFTIFATLLGVFAMIFTAWQMSDNPDGLFASLCRLIITSLQLIVRVLCSPCRKCMPCCFSYGNGNGYHEPYGHMPVSTMDYGYKDPSLELS